MTMEAARTSRLMTDRAQARDASHIASLAHSNVNPESKGAVTLAMMRISVTTLILHPESSLSGFYSTTSALPEQDPTEQR
jgi:hypothetical protein